MPFRLGPMELGLLLLLVLIFFGAGKLPQVGEAIGRSIRGFRTAQRVESEPTDREAKL